MPSWRQQHLPDRMIILRAEPDHWPQYPGFHPPQVAGGGAMREPDALIACSRPHRNAVAVPAPIVVFEVVSPGRGNRRRDEEKVDEYESVPSILRYVVVESESRPFRAFWREPGEQVRRRDAADTVGPIRLPEFGIELSLEEVYAGIDFD